MGLPTYQGCALREHMSAVSCSNPADHSPLVSTSFSPCSPLGARRACQQVCVGHLWTHFATAVVVTGVCGREEAAESRSGPNLLHFLGLLKAGAWLKSRDSRLTKTSCLLGCEFEPGPVPRATVGPWRQIPPAALALPPPHP